jgi:hypothetical protein
MKLVDEMTHDEIADFVALRLRKMNYPLSFSNITSANVGEQPDVLGVSLCGESLLAEVKISRSDFLADKKKPWRQPGSGMGDFRVYVTPKGLLKPSEIPYGWMLWEIHGKNKPVIKIIKGKKMTRESNPNVPWTILLPEYLNCDLAEYLHFQQDVRTKHCRSELIITVEIMRRALEKGIELNHFANKYQHA